MKQDSTSGSQFYFTSGISFNLASVHGIEIGSHTIQSIVSALFYGLITIRIQEAYEPCR